MKKVVNDQKDIEKKQYASTEYSTLVQVLQLKSPIKQITCSTKR